MNFIRLAAAALAVILGVSLNSFGETSLVYFGTYNGALSKGIYVSRFDPVTGKLGDPELAATMTNASFLAVAPGGHFLYAVSEVDQFNGQPTGAVQAFALDTATGKLTFLNQQLSGGADPCHISVDGSGKCLLVANYGGGSVAILPIFPDGSLGAIGTKFQHTGSSVNTNRQAGPHAHFILPSPDNQFTLDCDLGLDRISVNRLEASAARLAHHDPPFATVAAGSGPRHLVFSRDGRFVYVINELASTITVFLYHPWGAALTRAQTISTLPVDFNGTNTGAEIALHPDGRFLYASNRGHDSIAVFTVDRRTGRLTLVGHQSTLGRTPRHFAIDPTGRWLLAENQGSDAVVVFAIDPVTGGLKPTGQTIALGAPVCAVFAGTK